VILTPNKNFSLKETALYQSVKVMEVLSGNYDVHPLDLYGAVGKEFNSISDFIDCLKVLYILEKLSINDAGMIEVA